MTPHVVRIIARMNVGGPAVQVAGLSRGLPGRGFKHTLVTGSVDRAEEDYLETQAPDVRVIRVSGLGRAARPTDDGRALAKVAQIIRHLRPDVVHTHTAKAGVLGRAAARVVKPGVPLVHTFHGHLLTGYFGPTTTRMVTCTERELARTTDALVAVGAIVRDQLLAAGVGRPEQFRVIPPGLDFHPSYDRAEARRELGIPDGTRVVSFVGRLTGIKRCDRFADVVEIVRSQVPDAMFVVAGDGDQAPSLRKRIAAQALPITMLGWCDDVESVIAASDLLVLTSDNEGTPVSLIQAGMCGIPVVATNVGSVSEIVENGVSGLLAPTDSEAIAAAVVTLLRNSTMREQMGLAAAQMNADRYGVERLVSDHARLYEEVLRQSHARNR